MLTQKRMLPGWQCCCSLQLFFLSLSQTFCKVLYVVVCGGDKEGRKKLGLYVAAPFFFFFFAEHH